MRLHPGQAKHMALDFQMKGLGKDWGGSPVSYGGAGRRLNPKRDWVTAVQQNASATGTNWA